MQTAAVARVEGGPRGILRRIVAFPLTLMVLGTVVVLGVAVGVANLVRLLAPGLHNSPLSLAAALVTVLAMMLGYKAHKRWIEHQPDRELALPGALPELGAGLATGALLFCAMTGVVALMGGIAVDGIRGTGALWSMLAMAALSSVSEELVFRGLILRHLESLTGTWGALAITSVLFGVAHIFNRGATWFSSLAIALEAGLLLGGAYLLTRRLWLAIGIHAAWNFTQGWVFSVPVSGGKAPSGLLVTRIHGPEWLTGGAFGLEASVCAMVIATLAGLVLLVLARRRAAFRRPAWLRQTKL